MRSVNIASGISSGPSDADHRFEPRLQGTGRHRQQKCLPSCHWTVTAGHNLLRLVTSATESEAVAQAKNYPIAPCAKTLANLFVTMGHVRLDLRQWGHLSSRSSPGTRGLSCKEESCLLSTAE